MIAQPVNVDNVEFSDEQYPEILAGQWKHLSEIKQDLACEHEQDIHIAGMIAHIHEIIKILISLPDHRALISIVSRDAVLSHLQKAILELRLAQDQLLQKGKTRRYYTNLLVCQQHLDQALAQRRDAAWNWQGISWRRFSSLSLQNNWRNYVAGISIQQGRNYQAELPVALDALRCLHKLFQEDLEIWPDQCIRGCALVNDMQALVHDICSFLDTLACSAAAISPSYCQSVVAFHSIHKQVRDVAIQMARYRALCRSSALRAINTRQLICEALANLFQRTAESVNIFTTLLDHASFQERRENGEHSLSHFA